MPVGYFNVNVTVLEHRGLKPFALEEFSRREQRNSKLFFYLSIKITLLTMKSKARVWVGLSRYFGIIIIIN